MSRNSNNNGEANLPSSVFTQTRIKYKATPEENIEAFVSQVKDYLRLHKITDAIQQCAFFRMCLYGEAARWGEAHAHCINFDELLREFTQYFRSLLRIASVSHVRLPTFKKGKDLTKHILKFRAAINNVYPVPSETDLVHTFIKTLGYLSPYVIQKADSTLESVIADARESYTYKKQKTEYQLMATIKKRKSSKSLSKFKRKKQKRKSKDEGETSSDDSSSLSSSESESESNSTNSEEENKDVKLIKKQLKELKQELQSKNAKVFMPALRHHSPAEFRGQSRHSLPRRELRCQICNRNGHTARECYHRNQPGGTNGRPFNNYNNRPFNNYNHRLQSNYNAQTPYPTNYANSYNPTNTTNSGSNSYQRVTAQPAAKPLGLHNINASDGMQFEYNTPSAADIHKL